MLVTTKSNMMAKIYEITGLKSLHSKFSCYVVIQPSGSYTKIYLVAPNSSSLTLNDVDTFLVGAGSGVKVKAVVVPAKLQQLHVSVALLPHPSDLMFFFVHALVRPETNPKIFGCVVI